MFSLGSQRDIFLWICSYLYASTMVFNHELKKIAYWNCLSVNSHGFLLHKLNASFQIGCSKYELLLLQAWFVQIWVSYVRGSLWGKEEESSKFQGTMQRLPKIYSLCLIFCVYALQGCFSIMNCIDLCIISVTMLEIWLLKDDKKYCFQSLLNVTIVHFFQFCDILMVDIIVVSTRFI